MPKSANRIPSKGGTILVSFTKWRTGTRIGSARPGSAPSGLGMRPFFV